MCSWWLACIVTGSLAIEGSQRCLDFDLRQRHIAGSGHILLAVGEDPEL